MSFGIAGHGRIEIQRLFFLLPAVVLILTVPFLSGQTLEEENLRRVKLSLSENSIPFEERSLLADYGGFGSSLLIRNAAPASLPGTFVLAVPLDAGFAVDTALALAAMKARPDDSVNILVAFLGDENNELPPDMGGISHRGLRDLLSLVDMPENWILCYLDAGEAPEELVIRHGINGYVAPLDLMKPLPGLFETRRIPWSFKIRYNEIYKLGLVEGPEALSIALGEEINGFVLSGSGERKMSGETVSPEDLAGLLFDYAEILEFPLMEADGHYSIFALPGGVVFYLTEGITAALLIITVGIMLFIFLAYSARYNAILIFHFRLFLKYSWIFFTFLPLLVFSIKASGILYSFFLGNLGPSAADTDPLRANYAGAALTVLLAALFFFLPSPLLNLIHFPRRQRFYGFSAVIFAALGMFSAAFLDFSYVSVFLWAFLFVIAGSSISRPVLTFLSALLVPLIALGAIRNIVETGSSTIAELFISSLWNTKESWLAASQFGLLFLPVLLIAKRGTIMIQASLRREAEFKPNRKYRLILIPALMAVVLCVMLVQIRFIPGRRVFPEREYISETEDSANEKNAVLNIALDDTVFQDSRIIVLRAGGRGKPLRFDVSLESDSDGVLLPLYSASAPFERDDDGKRIHFLLGEHPPNPLVMEIVVPLGFSGLVKTAAVYNSREAAIDGEGKGGDENKAPSEAGEPASDDYVLTVTRTIDLRMPVS